MPQPAPCQCGTLTAHRCYTCDRPVCSDCGFHDRGDTKSWEWFHLMSEECPKR